jgi:uncharacterized OsmC-like protein
VGSTCISHTSDGFTITTDTPEAMGGGNSAGQPVYHLLSALVGCKTATAQFVARHMKIKVGTIQFTLEAVRDQRGSMAMPIHSDPAVPSMLSHVTGRAVLETDGSQEQVDALARQVDKRCPVASMLHNAGCEMQVEWIKA